MKRVAALVAAAFLVVAAFAVRDRTNGASDDGNTIDSATGLLCPTAFADACGTEPTESPGLTAQRLIEASGADALGADAWIVPAGWAEMVIDERARTGRPALWAIDPVPLASSPMVTAVWADRAEELADLCDRDLAVEWIDWSCLSATAGRRLGSGDLVRVGSPDIDSATGPMVAAAQASALLGRSDFAANDFDAAFRAAAEPLAAGQTSDPLARMRSRGPGELTAVGVVAAEARRLDSTFGTIRVDAVVPAVRVDIVALVPVGRRLDGGDRADVSEALRVAGWDTSPTDTGLDDGLPPGGVLAAIRTVWLELS